MRTSACLHAHSDNANMLMFSTCLPGLRGMVQDKQSRDHQSHEDLSLSICVKFHSNPSEYLKNVHLIVMYRKESEDHQSQQDLFSGDQECMQKNDQQPFLESHCQSPVLGSNLFLWQNSYIEPGRGDNVPCLHCDVMHQK